MPNNTVEITVASGGVGLPTVLVSVKTLLGVELNWALTDPNGLATFLLPDAPYRVYIGPLAGYGTANPYALTVSGDSALPVSLTAGASPVYGGLTWGQLKRLYDLQLRSHFDKALSAFPEDVKTTYLRLAYRQIDRTLRWTRDSVDTTLTIGVSIYALDRRVREILMVQYLPPTGNTVMLERIEQETMIERLGRGPANGAPANYSAHGDGVYLFPPPAAAGTVRVWAVVEAADLSQDSDVPGFLADLDIEIVNLAMGYAIEHAGSIQEGWARKAEVLARVEAERVKAGAGRNISSRLVTRGV